ncbi:hypothetical protein BDZ97DRAFT_1869727 [Flammula alnicola]|nr:hypothetical protein BDZ97DRAFT_1869727 [Flammula alnicola]
MWSGKPDDIRGGDTVLVDPCCGLVLAVSYSPCHACPCHNAASSSLCRPCSWLSSQLVVLVLCSVTAGVVAGGVAVPSIPPAPTVPAPAPAAAAASSPAAAGSTTHAKLDYIQLEGARGAAPARFNTRASLMAWRWRTSCSADLRRSEEAVVVAAAVPPRRIEMTKVVAGGGGGGPRCHIETAVAPSPARLHHIQSS